MTEMPESLEAADGMRQAAEQVTAAMSAVIWRRFIRALEGLEVLLADREEEVID